MAVPRSLKTQSRVQITESGQLGNIMKIADSQNIIDIQESMDTIRLEIEEFRKNPQFNINDELSKIIKLQNGNAWCPFCDKKLYIEYKSLLNCRDCPQGFFITNFNYSSRDDKLNLSKFTVTFENVVARVATFYDLNRGIILFQRVDDPEILKTAHLHNIDTKQYINFKHINFNYKDVGSIINKLKTYIIFT